EDCGYGDGEKDAKGRDEGSSIGRETGEDPAGLLAFLVVSLRGDFAGERAGSAEIALPHRGLCPRQTRGRARVQRRGSVRRSADRRRRTLAGTAPLLRG